MSGDPGDEPEDNVIYVDFGSGLPTSLEQSRDLILAVRETHVMATMDTVVDVFFQYLASAGFDFSDDTKYEKDVAFYLESLRSLISKKAGVDHPFQRIADETFKINKDGIVIWTVSGEEATKMDPLIEDEEVPGRGA